MSAALSVGRLLVVIGLASCAFGSGPAASRTAQGGGAERPPALPEIVVIPSLGTDHQFNLDYTVADLQALLDAIGPDAIIVSDFTEWLRAGCVWAGTLPENHAALRFAREEQVPLFGTRTSTSLGWYQGTVAAVRANRARHPDIASIRDGYRRRLEQTTARIAREYSFNPVPQTPEAMLSQWRDLERALVQPAQTPAAASSSRITADSILSVIAANPDLKRWVAVLQWQRAFSVGTLLQASPHVRVRPVEEFLPAAEEALPRRMDFVNTAWILSGLLDEWFGMWAPQVFPSERIARLMRSLEQTAPGSPVTRLLKARWHMRNRDYAAAEPILLGLTSDTTDSRIPFPVNPKWIRPPWTSIRDKARLNLAFVYDVRGARDSALSLYRGLLQRGEGLNAEAQAAGYNFDDIRSVIESYTRDPYTGLSEEAFRHFPATARIPACDPHKAELLKD